MIEGISITELRILTSANGSVMHGIRKGDHGYRKFGELYFSTINVILLK